MRVVEASKKWICVRPATYESAEESRVLLRWLRGVRGGGPDLRNTTFALLDPSGERALDKTGRAPQMVYKDVDKFVDSLDSLARKFEPGKGVESLPLIASQRLGLNISACDGLPLVAIIKDDTSEWKDLFSHLVSLSRTELFSGQAHYVLLEDDKDLQVMEGYEPGSFVYILKPDDFGVDGEVVASFQGKEEIIASAVRKYFDAAKVSKGESRQHVRKGKMKGISWESKIPRTDGRGSR